jgi:hypothetical protein
MATVPLSPALRMASSKPRWVICFMNVREVEFWKITGQKTDKMDYDKFTPFRLREDPDIDSFIRYQGDIQLSALVYASHQTTYHIFYYWLLYTLLVKP